MAGKNKMEDYSIAVVGNKLAHTLEENSKLVESSKLARKKAPGSSLKSQQKRLN